MLELLKNDDAEAFREFYFLWDERLYFYFLKKVKEENCGNDLAQLTFIKMQKSQSSLSSGNATVSFIIKANTTGTSRCVDIQFNPTLDLPIQTVTIKQQ